MAHAGRAPQPSNHIVFRLRVSLSATVLEFLLLAPLPQRCVAADVVFSTVGFLNLTSYSVIVTALFKNRITRVETLLLDLIREAAMNSTR